MKTNYLTLFIMFILINVLFTTSAYGANLVLNTGGRVSVELINSDAVFHNTLSLVSPSNVQIVSNGCNLESAAGLSGLLLLSEKGAQHGCRVEIDADASTAGIQGFAAGTTLEFNILAKTGSGDYIWSSDPTKNSDNYDHVKTTQLHPPEDIYQLAWEDQSNGGDQDFNDLIAVVRVNKDADGDGLWDDWEQSGIDTDGDGVVNLDLPALGANPNHKDIFLEIDYMDCAVAGGDCAPRDTHSHMPDANAVQEVVNAFRDSPVTNPDSTTGINLHVDVNNAIPHQNLLSFTGGTGIGDFDDVKADPANFGPTNPRRFAYHYIIFSHDQPAPYTGSSGVSEVFGNDLIVSLGGGWTGAAGSVREQSGTLMHELGHNLDLHHGGGDGILSLEVNCKPNYLSNMNYLWQFGLINENTLNNYLDYSRGVLDTLDESNLDERVGINDGPIMTSWTDSTSLARTGRGDGALDWTGGDFDHNGVNNDDHGVAVDINDFDRAGCGRDWNGNRVHSPGETLHGYNDWENLKYDFLTDVFDFEDGMHNNVAIPDMTFQTYLAFVNKPPVANPGGPYLGNEGSAINIDGSLSADPDAGDNIEDYHWDFGDGETGSEAKVTHIYKDNGLYTVSLTVIDTHGAADTKTTTANIANVAPTVGPITAPTDPQSVDTTISISSPYTDPGILDTHTATIDWNDGSTTAGIVTETGGFGSVTGSHAYNTPGIYQITLTITDKDGGVGTAVSQYVIIYDPNGGFVTGGGWINSSAGAYKQDPSLIGKTNFGFVSKYQKGATVPTGETEFQFHVASFNFKSTSYDWLVVSGARAQYKGKGIVNGTGNYGFLLASVDGQIAGGGVTDGFRIKIWDIATGTIVYDNDPGSDNMSSPVEPISGGSIVIHTK